MPGERSLARTSLAGSMGDWVLLSRGVKKPPISRGLLDSDCEEEESLSASSSSSSSSESSIVVMASSSVSSLFLPFICSWAVSSIFRFSRSISRSLIPKGG